MTEGKKNWIKKALSDLKLKVDSTGRRCPTEIGFRKDIEDIFFHAQKLWEHQYVQEINDDTSPRL